MTSATDHDVLVVGSGSTGLSAGVFTGRAGLETLVVNDGDPTLRRDAHLANYPGFPAGVNSRRLLDMIDDHAERAGCQRREARITALEPTDDGFVVEPHPDEPIQHPNMRKE